MNEITISADENLRNRKNRMLVQNLLRHYRSWKKSDKPLIAYESTRSTWENDVKVDEPTQRFDFDRLALLCFIDDIFYQSGYIDIDKAEPEV